MAGVPYSGSVFPGAAAVTAASGDTNNGAMQMGRDQRLTLETALKQLTRNRLRVEFYECNHKVIVNLQQIGGTPQTYIGYPRQVVFDRSSNIGIGLVEAAKLLRSDQWMGDDDAE